MRDPNPFVECFSINYIGNIDPRFVFFFLEEDTSFYVLR